MSDLREKSDTDKESKLDNLRALYQLSYLPTSREGWD